MTMSDDSKRVDQYIAQAPEFARPILERVRKAFHKGCPEVQETIKWNCPHFMYKGMLGGMSAFKEHVSFGFWKSKLMDDPENLFGTGTGKKASMCNAHIKSLKDLPAQSVLVMYVRQAKKLNDEGVKKDSRGSKKKIVVPGIPPDLATALKKNSKAMTYFDSLAPSHRREYLEWILQAKRPETREKRIAETIKLLNSGKRRNWKYERKP
jgi:uncharacterized protein YdeI (YjbR/CyaY-like superfamily)